ncbi:MAG: hypothetical protein K2Y71_03770 [Xanthobacteraceae bacterium]|nr:hypothetical protein [Xanthobacteraceae bacterium]
MANSIFLAKLIGPLLLAVGIGIFVNGAVYRMLADEFLRSRALIYLSGVLTMTAGLAIVLTHNVWRADWPVIITILGWLALIGGAVRIIAPQGTERIGRRVLKHKHGLTIGGIVWVAVGAILCVFGYGIAR